MERRLTAAAAETTILMGLAGLGEEGEAAFEGCLTGEAFEEGDGDAALGEMRVTAVGFEEGDGDAALGVMRVMAVASGEGDAALERCTAAPTSLRGLAAEAEEAALDGPAAARVPRFRAIMNSTQTSGGSTSASRPSRPKS